MSDSSCRKLTHRARKIDAILVKLYGEVAHEANEDPVDTLVETILSQNTTDKNSHRAYLALRKAYCSWDEILDEDPGTVADIIRSGGLADIKAERIISALRFIKHERGEIELDFLNDLSPAEADEWLSRMKGVGPKTRSIVLLFSLGMPTFPVDTHIHRVIKRLGLIGPKVSRESAQAVMASLVPEDRYFSFHINLIEHGRSVCRARTPGCQRCELNRVCDYRTARAKT